MEPERILPVILRAMLIADLMQPEILIFAPLIVFAAYIVFGITGFETPDAVEIANTLAASTGSLSIPNLKRVSPKSLTALIEKGNIELPPIEFIELIQEPDGGPTDDFVIPGDFPERGRR